MKRFFTLLLMLSCFTVQLQAQSLNSQVESTNESATESGFIPSTTVPQMQTGSVVQSQGVDVSRYMQSANSNSVAPAYQALSGETLSPQPYGASLFTGGYEAQRSDGINPDYKISPGDKVSIWLWGAVNFAEVLTVDNQGNLFVPEVGPVHVLDLPAGSLNKTVTDKIKAVYVNNVNVYVNLLNATPVSVFVTGPVIRPGKYAGLASDSVLSYLQRAGGIDPVRGSYREISLLRDDKVILSFDLYHFLRDGKLANVPFKDNDVLLVGQQGPSVVVDGAARYPFTFELKDKSSMGSELSYYARPLTKASHVGIIGNREDGPLSVYLPIRDFDSFSIQDGDRVLFNDDLRADVISIKVSGSYLGPSYYAVKRDTRLMELLSYIQVDKEQANLGSIYLRRKSVAAAQKRMIDESLQRLERSVFTAPTSSTGEAGIRAEEAKLVANFVQRARQIKPLGKVVVSGDGNTANIRLEEGDEVVIPQKSDLVNIAGEVLLPQAVVHNPSASISDYIVWAGGFTERAEPDRIAVVHANGLTTFMDIGEGSWYSGTQLKQISPGDEIIVLPKVDTKVLQAVKDITQIVYQIAVAANVALKD
ncbi:polysaccharide biosynthesis/export family protein [Bowmanella denitrificans]|uniref:polysaccharide biosynthesis/export family protein n=1 Tax=Bowmanella denitrificans TaxID=366582 RepID=UPI000C9CE6BF|nr:polysaccharide biosynthesis/export family protein [Bowmanella denitrificans]